MYFFF